MWSSRSATRHTADGVPTPKADTKPTPTAPLTTSWIRPAALIALSGPLESSEVSLNFQTNPSVFWP